jgi:DNA-binding CsgD family transcriptional regulator
VQALKAEGKGPAEIARELNISRQSVYRGLIKFKNFWWD